MTIRLTDAELLAIEKQINEHPDCGYGVCAYHQAKRLLTEVAALKAELAEAKAKPCVHELARRYINDEPLKQ